MLEALLSEKFWLPANVTWVELYAPRQDGGISPRPAHLAWSLLCGLAFCFIRHAMETRVLVPLGRRLGLPDAAKLSSSPAPPNPCLDAAFRTNRRPTAEQLAQLAVQVGWSERSVANWFRKRRNQFKSSTLRKFVESAWFLLHYTCILIYGFAALIGKDFFWDARNCWRGYPLQSVDLDIFWYYMVSLGFYWSAIYYTFTDVKRKDFAEMLLHHVVTVCLISFSWCVNYVRIGALVLVVHDIADPLLHITKCLSYASKNTMLRDIMFCVFMIGWLVTRLTVYPLWVMNSAMFHSWEIIGPFNSWYLFNGCLVILQVLHLIWFYFIVRIAFAVITKGPDARDSRSDSEMSGEAEVDETGDKGSDKRKRQ